MDRPPPPPDADDPGRHAGRRPMLAGIEVREEDLEPQRGLAAASWVFRACSAVLLALAVWQFFDWWLDRPPGNVGMAVLVGDTIRLVVVAALLWAASNLAALFIKSHYDLRATRILMARQAHMIRQIGIAQSAITTVSQPGERRGGDAGDSAGSVSHDP